MGRKGRLPGARRKKCFWMEWMIFACQYRTQILRDICGIAGWFSAGPAQCRETVSLEHVLSREREPGMPVSARGRKDMSEEEEVYGILSFLTAQK